MDPDVHLELVLRPGVVPVAGWLRRAGEPQHAFSGYVELMALVERLNVAGPRETEDAA